MKDLKDEELEVRPGGMLVQKRNSETNLSYSNNSPALPVVPMIRVRVKFGSSYHNVSISSQASFGELKKMLAEETGVHHQDQRLIYKKKERDSRMYLDMEKVKDGSKMTLIEDVTSRERRCLEMIKTSRIQKASKSIDQITTEVDTLVDKVISLEATSRKGGIVAEGDIDNLTESLMSRLVELDGILVSDGCLKLQKTTQERRVQKHIETLDILKSEIPSSNGASKAEKLPTKQRDLPQKHSEAAVVTTKWETFD